ncbi:MAG: hypothetical protein CMJ38_00090 [Phycisphaerae bacterium]|nr:hypothetical protein [Phycisphaerae bacterium]
MKILPSVLLVGLLLAGCGEVQEEEAIDWDDNESRDKIIAEALEFGYMPDKELRWKDSILAPHFVRRKVIVKSTKRLFTGWMKDMYDNEQIKSLKQYKDGIGDGLRIEWYEHGQKKREATHKDGKLVTAVAWKPNGEKCPETNILNGNGVSVEYSKLNTGGFAQTYRSTYKEGEVVIGENDQCWSSWYENGHKCEEKIYKEGKLMSAVVWKPNGEKCPVTNVVNGNGVWARYNEDGTEKSRDTYKDSKRNGLSTRWDENGQKQEEENWKDGKQDGLETRWYSNGQKRSERNWKDDKLDGVAVFYHESGTESNRETYKDGKRVRD